MKITQLLRRHHYRHVDSSLTDIPINASHLHRITWAAAYTIPASQLPAYHHLM
jgi:hypothetical protein